MPRVLVRQACPFKMRLEVTAAVALGCGLSETWPSKPPEKARPWFGHRRSNVPRLLRDLQRDRGRDEREAGGRKECSRREDATSAARLAAILRVRANRLLHGRKGTGPAIGQMASLLETPRGAG